MCPICVGSAMLLLSGAGSASGVAALTLRSITRRRHRTARWMIEHRPGDAAVSGQEDVAITEIDRAIYDVRPGR